jgi:hypothetical protein
VSSFTLDLLNLFELVSGSEKFTFNCITEDEKRSWMKDMQEGTHTTRTTRHTAHTAQHTHASVSRALTPLVLRTCSDREGAQR